MKVDDLKLGNMAKLTLSEIAKEVETLRWDHGSVKVWDQELARRAALATIQAANATYFSAIGTCVAAFISSGALVVAALTLIQGVK